MAGGRDGAYRLADPPRVRAVREPPKRAVLVDDVLTTGATLGACAAALRAGGAERIGALTFARSLSAVGVGGPARRAYHGNRSRGKE